MKSKGGLGKGLEALIPQMGSDAAEDIVSLRTDELRPNPYQPRREFDEDKLQELVESIREHGVLQPIVVRKSAGLGYEIIAGERRFRAVRRLGMPTIPGVVRDISDRQAMEIALIENLQREDLNPIEIAEAYAKFMELFGLTQEQLAARVGQSRSHVANLLRLLSLPEDIRVDVSRGTLTMGHARALLGSPDERTMRNLARRISEEGLNVRDIEALVQSKNRVSRETSDSHSVSHSTEKVQAPKPDPTLRDYEERFREFLGTSVRIHNGKRRGKIEIEYFSLDDLERILHFFQR